MKRVLFSLFLLAALVSVLAAATPAQEQKTDAARDVLTRSYELKHISPRSAVDILRSYIFNFSFGEGSNLLTVTLARANLAPFEENLQRIDVAKRAIQFRIFTVIASPTGESGPIDNPDLKGVLDDLKNLLSFRAYRLDGVSVITVNEGSAEAELQLSSSLPGLGLGLRRLRVDGDAPAVLKFGLRLRQFNNPPLVDVDETALNAKGYLVAGVSKLAKEGGDSLVLVINAEIKK